MGDIIHSLPVLNALFQNFKDAEIHWLIAKGLDGLLQNHPMIKKLLIINKDQWKKINSIGKTIKELSILSKSLRYESYDIVIDLQGLLRSGILTAMTGAPFKIGFSDAREGSSIFYNQRVKGDKDIHAVNRYLRIIKALTGIETKEIKFPFPPFNPSNEIIKLVDSLKDYYVIVPGARWQSKRWSPDKFAEAACLLENRSIIIGGKDDIPISQFIKEKARDKVIDLTDKTNLKDLVFIISQASLVLTNDTGPMHIASALERPLLAIFGPTNPIRTGPFGTKHKVIKAEIACSPCYKRTCSKMDCMNNISVNKVISEIKSLSL
ncbi:MAG TPA: glycosyltransferase family 9 protein [Nitrospirae bacterium]|nr:glycosyltransferase family 9 protein [Nitrospirota bacterium]